MRFRGQAAIVTGAARGMDRAIAEAFAREGVTVALWSRTPERFGHAAVEIGGGAFAVSCDVGSALQVENAFAHNVECVGRVHVRVSAVNPGYARTYMTIQCFPPKQQAFLTKGFIRAPLRRIVEPSEVANAFTFRASR